MSVSGDVAEEMAEDYLTQEYQVIKTKKMPVSTLKKDFDPLPFTEDLKKTAESIYRQFKDPAKKSRYRNQLVFATLYYAHLELGIKKDPRSIAKIVGLSSQDVSNALSNFSETQTGYRPKTAFFTVPDLIPGYCQDFGLNDEITDEILYVCGEILTRSPQLKNKPPQTVAAGIIRFFFEIYGIKAPPGKFLQVTHLSDATITAMYKQIAKIYNSKQNDSPSSSCVGDSIGSE